MKFFKKKSVPEISPEIVPTQRDSAFNMKFPDIIEPVEKELYDRIRNVVPVVDAGIMKIIRLTGGFRVICSDEKLQPELDYFLANVPVGLGGKSVNVFVDNFLDSILTYGSAVGEIVPDSTGKSIAGLWNGDISRVRISTGSDPFSRKYTVTNYDGKEKMVTHPERIIYTELTGRRPVLRGVPALAGILMRIYECIGQNFDRAGNVRYAVTYRPSTETDYTYARERAVQIAKEWSDAMKSSAYGQVKDFVAVGDVDIKVIGAENQLFDTNVPVRQLMEQIIAKLSIPPFLLGLNWSSTERMSSQQADILTSELEYYRRLLTPVIIQIAEAFVYSTGNYAVCRVEWDNINLQDESELAIARLHNAQAMEIEKRLETMD
ncbi:MAG: phage portal protein [Ruminococcus sp.]|nr:phage portal protein [Ruminococcus sp.]